MSTRGSSACAATPSAAPMRLPSERHRPRLQQVGREHLRAGRAEAAQHADGLDAPPQQRLRRAGHRDPAQQQRDQPDQAEVAAHARERRVQRLLVLGDGAQRDALGGEGRLVAIGEALRPRGGGQAQERLVTGAGAEAQEAGRRDVARGHEHPRSEGRAHADVAGHVQHGGADREMRIAERQDVADLRVEGQEQGRVDHDPAARGEARPLAGRVGLHLAVERVSAVHRHHLHEPRARGARDVRHGREADRPRPLRARAGLGRDGRTASLPRPAKRRRRCPWRGRPRAGPATARAPTPAGSR